VRPIDRERRQQCLDELRARFPGHADAVMAAVDVNPSADLPYHGTPHLFVVALAALELAAAEGLSPAETDTVFLAALFHDWGYLEDPDDRVNIAAAAAAAREHLGFTDAPRVAEVIEGSCFPYGPEAPDRVQAVLRDADVLYSTLMLPDSQHFRTGLYLERGAPATEQDAIAFILGHGAQTTAGARAVTAFLASTRPSQS
jgi:predicted metal-dependent HD superfamily phosphohydrolase